MSTSIKTGVMGIVGCQVLEDEIAYVVSHDEDIKRVLIIDGTQERTIAEKIRKMAPSKLVMSFGEEFNFKQFQMSPELTVILWLKPISLHQSPPTLREDVMKAVKALEPLTKSVMLFYGQCGSAFRNMEIITNGVHVPLTILKDADGSLIDDCFGTALGGKEEYRLFLVGQPGPSYVINSMWAANWRHFMFETQMLRDPNDLEEAKEIFKYMDYKRVVGLNTGLADQAVFEHQLEEFGRLFELQPENRRCSLRIVESAYREAKQHLTDSA
jgi:hypothetical protein